MHNDQTEIPSREDVNGGIAGGGQFINVRCQVKIGDTNKGYK